MKPNIIVSLQDLERLETLLDSLPASFDSKDALLNELGRAEIIESTDMPPTVVTMHSKVRFEIDHPHEEFCLTLVYPKELTQGANQISVLTPIGTALLGLSVGDVIDWPRRDGQMSRVRILDVLYQPEHSADFIR
ncbi:nucleoside diphosphate kinase regulator [Noviherbaspirillum sp.]|uniref:nucleoside diphosphate kinase regulator n=1 Tax=Noviherbaspirillum sp. TaxID=1926288 RepID=UPI002FE1559D